MAFKLKTLSGLIAARLHIKTAGGIVPVALHEKTADGIKYVSAVDYAPEWDVATYNTNYSTALAAVSNGQYFGQIVDSGEVAHVFQKTGSVGVYQGTVLYKNGVQSEKNKTARISSGAGTASGAFCDIAAVDSYFAANKIRNRARVAPDLNALGSSKPAQLLSTDVLRVSSSTVTVVEAEDGSMSALRVVSTGSGGDGVYIQPIQVPAGVWTFSLRAKTQAGSNQTVSIGTGPTANTITNTWSTFSATSSHLTDTSQLTLFLAFSQGAAFDVTIDQIRFTPGSASGAVSTADHPFVVKKLTDRESNVVSTETTTAPSIYIPIDSDVNAVRDRISCVVAIKKTGADSSIEDILSGVEVSGLSINTSPSTGLYFGSYSGHFQVGGKNAATTRMVGVKQNDGWQVFGFVCGPNGSRLYVDDLVLASSSAAWTGFQARLLQLMAFRSDPNYAVKGRIASCVIYLEELTDAQMKSEVSRAKRRVSSLGESVDAITNVLLAEGDSITAGSGSSSAPGYVMQIGPRYTPRMQGYNQAVINSSLYANSDPALNLEGRLSKLLTKIAEVQATGRRAVVSVQIGANDTGTIATDVNAYYQRLSTYWQNIRATGAKLIAGTVLPQQSLAPNVETARLQLNTLIRSDTSRYDGLADYAADPAFSSGWSSTYFADSAHPNDNGHTAMGNVLNPVVGSLRA